MQSHDAIQRGDIKFNIFTDSVCSYMVQKCMLSATVNSHIDRCKYLRQMSDVIGTAEPVTQNRHDITFHILLWHSGCAIKWCCVLYYRRQRFIWHETLVASCRWQTTHGAECENENFSTQKTKKINKRKHSVKANTLMSMSTIEFEMIM